jgi:hypothetical protein
VRTGPRLAALALASHLVVGGMARAGDLAAHENASKPLPDPAARLLIETVQQDWRAKSGETAAQMLQRLPSIAHFLPRRWSAWSSSGGKDRVDDLGANPWRIRG